MNRAVAALLVVVLVLAALSGRLYTENKRLDRLCDTTARLAGAQAQYDIGCIAGNLFNMRTLAGRNETLALYTLLYNTRNCAMGLSMYFRLLEAKTGDINYTAAANALEDLAIWFQDSTQIIILGGENASLVTSFLNQSQELMQLYTVLAKVDRQMGRGPGEAGVPPGQAAEIARAVRAFLDAAPGPS